MPAISNRPFVCLLCIAVLVVATGCTHGKTDTEATPVLSGPPSTSFPMPPLKVNTELGWLLADGSRQRLADYRGKVLVLDFYATWCVPCRQSIPHLVRQQNELGAKGLQVVGLNVGGADDRIKVTEFAHELGVNYPLGFPDKALTDLFLSDDQTIPQTFVFGRDGQLMKRLIGYQQSTNAELEKAIEAAIETKREQM